MASTIEYRDFILEQLELLEDITYRPMMGEFLLYYKGILFGGIYDNRLLIKIVKENEHYHLSKQIPYDGAKEMYGIEELTNQELVKQIIIDTCDSLAKKKVRKKGK